MGARPREAGPAVAPSPALSAAMGATQRRLLQFAQISLRAAPILPLPRLVGLPEPLPGGLGVASLQLPHRIARALSAHGSRARTGNRAVQLPEQDAEGNKRALLSGCVSTCSVKSQEGWGKAVREGGRVPSRGGEKFS